MAKIPALRRLLVEDFKSQRAWISPMVIVLNNFMEAVVNALDKALTVVDNTTGDIKTLTLSAVPTESAPAKLAWTKAIAPTVVIVGNVTMVGGGSFTLSSAVQVQWEMPSSKVLSITNVTGITPSSTNQYILTLLCLAG